MGVSHLCRRAGRVRGRYKAFRCVPRGWPCRQHLEWRATLGGVEPKSDHALIFLTDEIAQCQLGGVVAWHGVIMSDHLLLRRNRLKWRAVAEIPPAVAAAGRAILKRD